MLPLLAGGRFQVLFTPLTGVLFTFPSRYWFTIGCRVVFSLVRRSSLIPAGFHVSRSTWVSGPERTTAFHLRDFHPLRCDFPDASTVHRLCNFPNRPKPVPAETLYPAHTTLSGLHVCGLGSFPFARRYSENHCCFLFLGLLRCFSSPRSPPQPMCSAADVTA